MRNLFLAALAATATGPAYAEAWQVNTNAPLDFEICTVGNAQETPPVLPSHSVAQLSSVATPSAPKSVICSSFSNI